MWTKDDFIMWVCILGFSCAAFFAGLSAGKQAASRQLREQAVEEGVGFWSVDKQGKTRFVFSKRELPLVQKDKPLYSGLPSGGGGGNPEIQLGAHDFFLGKEAQEEEEKRMMMFYKTGENLGVCNGEGCKEIHP